MGLARPSGTSKRQGPVSKIDPEIDPEINPELRKLIGFARERRNRILDITTAISISESMEAVLAVEDNIEKTSTALVAGENKEGASAIPINGDTSAHEKANEITKGTPARKPATKEIQPSNTATQLSNIVTQFSSPTFSIELPFPYIGITLQQFKIKSDNQRHWFYIGREKFTELVNRVQALRESGDTSALWVYGTKGYGKSHLLAALVCYLTAQKEWVVYIPDC